MGRHCAVLGCTNNSRKESCKKRNISFHGFPLHDPPRLKKWLSNMGRNRFIPNSYSAVCSEHFDENDFIYQTFTKTRLLKKDAIPTKFPENEYSESLVDEPTEGIRKMESRTKAPVHQGKKFKPFIGRTEKRCNKCGFVTFSLHVLYNHKCKCQGQLLGKPVSCCYCKRKFSFVTLYRAHRTTCIKKFLQRKILRNKLKQKHLRYRKKIKQTADKFSFSCPICRASFKSKSSFVSHLKQKDCTQQAVKKNSFSARKSFNKKAKSSSVLNKTNRSSAANQEENFYESVNNEAHRCNWCKSDYPTDQLFFMHLGMNEHCAEAYYKNHINNANKKLPSKARKTISVVAKKSFSHRKYTEKEVFNNKRSFTSRNARKTLTSSHKKKLHGSVSSMVSSVANQCPVCCKKFPDTFTFYQHQKKTNHWGKATKSFNSSCKCPFCGKDFLHIKSRNAHVFNHSDKSENEIKAFLRSCTCSVCSQTFVSESAKMQHMKIKHPTHVTNNIKYSSSGSELNATSDNEYADKHKMSSVPSSVKKKLRQQPNTCPVCSKAFSHTVLRNKHFNEVHLKIFECQFCNTKFKSTSSLSNHIQLSHGKSLDCKTCRVSFINELQLLQHVLKYHPYQDPKLFLSSPKAVLSKEKFSNVADELKLRPIEKVSSSSISQRRNIEYYCDVCNIGYLKLCGLQRHRQSKLHKDTLVKNLDAFQKSLSDVPSSPPPYPRAVKQPDILTCSECSEDFTSIKDFVPHRLSHFSVQSKYLKINELNPYMCEICSDVLDSHSKVQLHLFWHLQIESTSNKNANVVSNKNDTIVPDRLSGQHVAKKSFSKSSSESLQEVVIGGVTKPLFTCEACNIGFTTKVHYNMHIRKLCKKLRPSNQFSKHLGSEIEMDKNSSISIVHCGNCNCIFSSETKFEQHKEFCVKCYYDDNSEENINNSDIIKSALDFDTIIAGCVTCAALFDSISSVAVHLNIHQTHENSISEEIADVLHCALCNCLFSLSAFKMHKDFCKVPINIGSKIKHSKHINVLKSALELKCAVAACITCGLPFDDIEAFSEHLMLHQTNRIQNELDDKRLCNGKTSLNTNESGNSVPENPRGSTTKAAANSSASDDEDHDSPLNSATEYPSDSEGRNHKSIISDSKNKALDDTKDLQKNFSQLLCLLISDAELMQKLGYGTEAIDKVLVNVLQQMGQEPCTDSSSETNLFRKNIQKFLSLCLKDKVLQAIGKEKPTDEIVIEALKIFIEPDESTLSED